MQQFIFILLFFFTFSIEDQITCGIDTRGCPDGQCCSKSGICGANYCSADSCLCNCNGSKFCITKARNQAYKDSEKIIWNYLYNALNNNPYGVAGLMGNLYGESELISNNLQNCNAAGNWTDSTYTTAVDNGQYRSKSYTNAGDSFAHDSLGYGLAQWTYWTRKQNLYKFAKSKNTSVGDLNMQLEFLIKELGESFKNNVLVPLKSATSVQAASDIVIINFERPQSVLDGGETCENAKAKREGYSLTYYNRYAKDEACTIKITTADSLNIRTGPSTSYDSVRKVPLGTYLCVIAVENGWAKLSDGYCSDTYLREVDCTPTTTPTDLKLHTGPGNEYVVSSTVPRGTDICVVYVNSDNWALLIDGKYCDNSLLSNSNSVSESNTLLNVSLFVIVTILTIITLLQ